eukprot:1539227-Prymnesium_polylepis.1
MPTSRDGMRERRTGSALCTPRSPRHVTGPCCSSCPGAGSERVHAGRVLAGRQGGREAGRQSGSRCQSVPVGGSEWALVSSESCRHEHLAVLCLEHRVLRIRVRVGVRVRVRVRVRVKGEGESEGEGEG